MEKLLKERGVTAFQSSPIAIDAWTDPVPTSEEDLAFLPINRLAALLQSGKLTSVDLTRLYLDRLKRFDGQLLCAVTIMEDQAMEAAQQADREIKSGHYRGPLHGIPWGVKDLFAVKGTPTTWGANEFETRTIDADAEVVVRLRNAGAVLIAKLATGRFAMGDQWYRGRTNNPWNLKAGSSGSSAGPASATAAGCVAFAIGTETRGSIVSPASVCGITALRPTFGRVSRAGGMTLAWSMDRVGPMCRCAFDCALVFNAIHGVDENDPSTLTTPFQFDPSVDISKLRIGYDRSAPADFIAKLKDLGANPQSMPSRPRVGNLNSLDPESAAAFSGDLTTGVLQDIDSPNGGRGSGRFTAGKTTSAVEFLNIQRHRMRLMQAMAKIMMDFDLYISNNDLGDCTLTSLTGHPAVVLPWNFASVRNGPPQPQTTTLVGNLFADDKILSVASAFQKATQWHTHRPTLAGA
jgi:Asp-tRNA(Asn)/Glu-tRNA(Gln) amidotransferase A subunit family amidase